MMEMSQRSRKRIRSANYSAEEVDLLVNLVGRYTQIIENKKSDAKTWEEKLATWELVASQFNAKQPNIQRTADQLRMKYDSLKGRVKQKINQIRQNPGAEPLTPAEAFVRAIMKQRVPTGVEYRYDEPLVEINTGEQILDARDMRIKTEMEDGSSSFSWSRTSDIQAPPIRRRLLVEGDPYVDAESIGVVVTMADASCQTLPLQQTEVDPLVLEPPVTNLEHSKPRKPPAALDFPRACRVVDSDASSVASSSLAGADSAGDFRRTIDVHAKRRSRMRNRVAMLANLKRKKQHAQQEHALRMTTLHMEKVHKLRSFRLGILHQQEKHQLELKILQTDLAIKEATLEAIKSKTSVDSFK